MDMQTRYNTSDVAARERVAYWRDAVCASYVQLGCDAIETNGFSGSIDIARHSILSISRVAGKAQRVERRSSDIRASTDPFFLLSLQTAKTSRITQFGHTSALNTGDMALYSSTDPYLLELPDDFSQTVVQLPTARLLDRLPHAEMLAAKRIDGQSGIGQLVRQNILAFSDYASSDDPTMQALVQDTLIDLIATGLASRNNTPLELSSPEQQMVMRTKAFVHRNLGDPDLDRNRVAQEMGMSVRRLNDVFSKDGESIASFIRHKRLQAVAADLRDPRFDAQSISEIAFRFGFSNLQNFSTVFRQVYQQTPRDYRNTRH